MPKLVINGKEIEVPVGSTVFQACQNAGVEIPHFCFHDRLEIAGNCRMCLVEMERAPKPIASCAMPAADGMVIRTDTPLVEKARKGVMEFLLINHPLDCPICDQGGECDLQDQAMGYGFPESRYKENKRAVKDKNMGPLIKTHMTRCIHCTRCVRFMEDIAGVPTVGAVGRGEHMEITTFLEQGINSEMSGNIIDLCPVGALTNKPYAFVARPWELKKTETIDVLDAVGSNIRVDSRGSEVMRIMPRLNENINQEWIADKSRFACDGLKRQRLDRPYIRKNGKLEECDWETAFDKIVQKIKKTNAKNIAALAGNLSDVESMFALQQLMISLKSPHMDCRTDGAQINVDDRASYLFNTTIAGIENADYALMIGTNPRHEAPIINTRLRQQFLRGKLKLAMVGQKVKLTYPYDHLGDTPDLLEEILSGKHPAHAVLQSAQNPMIILGAGVLTREDGAEILSTAMNIAEKYNVVRKDWNGFNVLHHAASRVGGLDIGFVPGKNGKTTSEILSGDMEMVYLLGADEIDMKKLKKSFVIYQGHHGDQAAQAADVILPGAAYTEKDAIYVNTEGRPQHATQAIFPPGQAKEDWKIIRALSERLGQTLPFNSLNELRDQLAQKNATFKNIGTITPAKWKKPAKPGKMNKQKFTTTIENYYMSDVISRHSETMAKCTQEFMHTKKNEAA